MTTETIDQLQEQQCKPCEGGVDALSTDQAREQVAQLEGWSLQDDSKRISKSWKKKDFMAGMKFLNEVAELAEQEGHHPDVSLKNYREVTVELTTHAIGGLSQNDFILAAKIERVDAGQS